jgi:exonuclease III
MHKLSIWQQNINKSPSCQHDIISNIHLTTLGINLIALQEPALSGSGITIATRDWITIYPTNHANNPLKTRSITLIKASVNSDNWSQLDFPSSDVTVTQITGDWGKITVFNIYKDGESEETVRQLTEYHSNNRASLERTPQGEAHIIWLGDFNRHHPYWDNLEDLRLFTNEATEAAEKLIEAVADAGLKLALPSGIPTHEHSATKRWSRLDQVFLSSHSNTLLISCDTVPDKRGINTDHLPVHTELSLEVNTIAAEINPSFWNVNWEDFRTKLAKQLARTPAPMNISEAAGRPLRRADQSPAGSDMHGNPRTRNHT